MFPRGNSTPFPSEEAWREPPPVPAQTTSDSLSSDSALEKPSNGVAVRRHSTPLFSLPGCAPEGRSLAFESVRSSSKKYEKIAAIGAGRMCFQLIKIHEQGNMFKEEPLGSAVRETQPVCRLHRRNFPRSLHLSQLTHANKYIQVVLSPYSVMRSNRNRNVCLCPSVSFQNIICTGNWVCGLQRCKSWNMKNDLSDDPLHIAIG